MGFSQALSGLNAASSSLDVLGNNIANSQTVGYKSSSAQFADVFAGAKGLGTKVSAVLQDFGAGNIEATGRGLDLAISGQGFYRFQQDGEVVYSRNGQLSMTADGFLQNAQGARLMGYGLNAQGEVQVGGQPEVLNISSEELAARATSDVFTTLNLDARNMAGEGLSQTQVTTNMQNPGSPANQEKLEYHYSNNFSVYDSLGQSHSVSIYYEKRPEAENSWLAKVVMDGYYDLESDPVGHAASKMSDLASGAKDVTSLEDGGVYSELKESITALKESLVELKDGISTAADNAVTNSASVEEARQAVTDAANNTIAPSGATLSEVLERYLNGEQLDDPADEVLAAYWKDVKDKIEADTVNDASGVKTALNGVDPMTDFKNEFEEFIDKKSASISEERDPVYSDLVSEITKYIKGAINTKDIAAAVVDAEAIGSDDEDVNAVIDFKENESILSAVQAVVSGPAEGVEIDIEDIEEAGDIDEVFAAATELENDNPEKFDAFGTNDFVVEFNADGSLKRVGQPELTESGLKYVDVDNNNPQISFSSNAETPLGGATKDLKFTMDLSGSTQFGNNSQVGDLSQNGYASGSLVGITIEDDGTVMKNYTNEQSVAAGQIVLANFRNPEGLEAVGDNAWTATGASGQELVGVAGTGLLGSIQSGAIETSNVDLAKQLVDMIVTQRAYQANSQTIKTQDEVLQASINLSR